jgi:ATP-dependent Clp protease ATP-binding subunit ClpA
VFDHYSKGALRVIFAARYKAGERGSDAIDVGDLVVGLVLEDQGKMGEVLSLPSPSGVAIDGLDAHAPFIQPEAATRLLLSVENNLTHSRTVPTSVDLPLSVELQAVFTFAEELRTELVHERMEPLHLLAGVFQEKSGVFSDQFREAGITQDSVIAKLRETGGKQ